MQISINRNRWAWKLNICLFTLFCLIVAGCDEAPLAVKEIAGTPMAIVGDELVSNGDFSSGADGWYLGQWGGASSGAVSDGHYVIDVTAAGTEWWNVQFQQGGLSLEQGKRYTIEFDAWKGPQNTGIQKMQINVGEDGGDYTAYMYQPFPEVTLGTEVSHYSFAFDMREPTDSNARIEFNCGLYTGTFHIDDVSVTEVAADGAYLNASKTSIKFDVAEPGSSQSETLVLANNGTLPVTVGNISTNDVAFVLESEAPLTVPAGGSITVLVKFAPSYVGTFSAVLTVVSDAEDNPSLLVALSGVSAVSGPNNGAYQPQSPYILNPELNIDFVRDIATFRTRGKDDEHGGFYTNLNRSGYPIPESQINEKSMCGQSRLAYAFVRAFMLTGDEIWLDYARHALAFMYRHAWNNGWYFLTDVSGDTPVWPWGQVNWWSFQQHYAMVGITAMVEATGGGNLDWGDGAGTDREWLETGIDNLNSHLWDTRAGYEGYFNRASIDWSSHWEKGFTPTVDAVTTHASLLDLMFDDPDYENRLMALADNIIDHLAASMDGVTLGWPEVYNNNWQVDTSSNITDVGHVYKTAWVLQRISLRHPGHPELNEAAQKMMWNMWNNGGFDKVVGAPFSQFNWDTGEITNKVKDHWMLEQAVTSGLINYYVADSQTDKNMYLEVADKTMQFYMAHQVDHEYGDVFDKVKEDGSDYAVISKGGMFNGGYHPVEMGYFTYLYASLYYHDSPVSLYYRIPASNRTQSIRLTPVAIEDNLLKIFSVELDGNSYVNFDGDTRVLTIPASVGGTFKVTFGKSMVCGDTVCSATEDCLSCAIDCGACAICGDGACDDRESCTSCSEDCGECEFCGDGVCTADEDCSSCATDCGACQFCGDDSCDAGETCGSCSEDCGVCELSCGDNICNGDETCASCPADCGACPEDNCTCPNGCDAIVNVNAPFSADGVAGACYFFENIGNFINSWNCIDVNINGQDITNVYLGNWNYPAKINNGYYLYYQSNVPWGHVEVK